MTALTNNSTRSLGYADFDIQRVEVNPVRQCPVKNCSTELTELTYGEQCDKEGKPRKRIKLWCKEHRIRLHSGTFVYWNCDENKEGAQLRNFLYPELAKEIALKPKAKAESHRLGYEMSEDALSWNVFVSLAVAGKLKSAAEHLTERRLSREPSLYLWGNRIDISGGEQGIYAPLLKARRTLEGDIRRFGTEPDIMLVIEGEMVICIEAKFGSGNPLAYDPKPKDGVKAKDGEKPTSRAELIERYIGGSTKARDCIHADLMAPTLHSQLFRNVVFAAEMAEADWHVVNLVSKTQLKEEDNPRYSFADPTRDVRSYLNSESQKCFTYRTWEGLYQSVVQGAPELLALADYMRDKSAHYRRAFELT
jgi:hypothetical protein